jgi:hypothetical protein
VTKYHPDLHQGNPLEDLARARLVEINRAYEILSDGRPGPAAPDAGSRAETDGRPGAAPSLPGKRLIAGAVILVFALPFLARFGAALVRGLVGVVRELLAAPAPVRAGCLVVAALAVVAYRRLRRRM